MGPISARQVDWISDLYSSSKVQSSTTLSAKGRRQVRKRPPETSRGHAPEGRTTSSTGLLINPLQENRPNQLVMLISRECDSHFAVTDRQSRPEAALGSSWLANPRPNGQNALPLLRTEYSIALSALPCSLLPSAMKEITLSGASQHVHTNLPFSHLRHLNSHEPAVLG